MDKNETPIPERIYTTYEHLPAGNRNCTATSERRQPYLREWMPVPDHSQTVKDYDEHRKVIETENMQQASRIAELEEILERWVDVYECPECLAMSGEIDQIIQLASISGRVGRKSSR